MVITATFEMRFVDSLIDVKHIWLRYTFLLGITLFS
jgi:hypothetical protein